MALQPQTRTWWTLDMVASLSAPFLALTTHFFRILPFSRFDPALKWPPTQTLRDAEPAAGPACPVHLVPLPKKGSNTLFRPRTSI